MKRYLVFASAVDFPAGGWSDFISAHDSLDEAVALAHEKANPPSRAGWAHVVDLKSLTVVWSVSS